MKNKIFYILIVLIAIFSVWSVTDSRFHDKSNGKAPSEKLATKTPTLTINSIEIPIEIADTEEERTLGLSGRASLPAEKGLLFIFESPDKRGFWMKDMKFPIDIVWLDEKLKIIDITKSLPPESYPAVFTSNSPAQYVLEVNAGFTLKNNIKIGDTAILNK